MIAKENQTLPSELNDDLRDPSIGSQARWSYEREAIELSARSRDFMPMRSDTLLNAFNKRLGNMTIRF